MSTMCQVCAKDWKYIDIFMQFIVSGNIQKQKGKYRAKALSIESTCGKKHKTIATAPTVCSFIIYP